MKQIVETDVAILGGGIAGLWLLNRLRQQGYATILLETATLGGGQTHKSQGIIHSGMKYALQGVVSPAVKAIADMPRIWQDCLQGKGEIDLRAVPILSSHQYLWTTGAITSKLAGFFASIALKGNVQSLKPDMFPPIFRHPDFKGQVYSLDEMVVDVHSLIKELAKPNQDVIFKIDPLHSQQVQFSDTGHVDLFEVQAAPMKPVQIKAKKYIFAAGQGNEMFLKKLSGDHVGSQLRPLHMVVVKHNLPFSVYAHCLGIGATPRMTITTHHSHDGKVVWYLGGQIAEEGVKRTEKEQIDLAQKELAELFPWLDFSGAEFSSFRVDRAEARQPGGKRPDSCFIEEVENAIFAWPTKLAFAPLLAEEIIQVLARENIKTGKSNIRELRAWPIPGFAQPMWS